MIGWRSRSGQCATGNGHRLERGSWRGEGTSLDQKIVKKSIEHKGRKEKILYPKKPGSFYHLSKVHDSHNIEFCCRNWGLRCTDLNQGVVYGINTSETRMLDSFSTSFHYDDVFGTVINRFIAQVIINKNLTVYGKGNQKRGYLNILDTLECIKITLNNMPAKGEYRVFNQFTEIFSINEIAEIVRNASIELGYKIKIDHINNPRNELEEHYYNPKNISLLKLGLKHKKFNNIFVKNMIKDIEPYKKNIDHKIILPKVKW